VDGAWSAPGTPQGAAPKKGGGAERLKLLLLFACHFCRGKEKGENRPRRELRGEQEKPHQRDRRGPWVREGERAGLRT